ncbi:MAG: hypothetical protein JJU40_00360 [Rhodobacteraceae bacterium]|nr:hypothetical protein [Paracoccaceae bacterium]
MTAILLYLHIVAGAGALVTAGLAIGSVKGGPLHRRAGKGYVLAMLATSASALILSVVHPSPFLFAVGIFSFYLVFSGWRAALIRDGYPRAADHAGGAVMAACGLGMMGWGAVGLVSSGGAQPVILLAFGAIGLSLALADWRDWRRGPVTGPARIVRHLSRMMGGTIATVTAAGVVNLGFLPELVVWLGPTILFTPLIAWWSARTLRGRTPA